MSDIIEKNKLSKYTDYMCFDTDDDFYKFSVNPVVIVEEYTSNDGDQRKYATFDFSNAYKDAIKNNIAFVIRDRRSNILKHNGMISYRTISKQTENLHPWYFEKIFSKKLKKEE